MRPFVSIHEMIPQTLQDNHGGSGPLEFRRLLNASDFASPVDFVDFTVIPPGSTIGIHRHDGNEEIYYIASGNPRVAVNGDQRRLGRGSIAVVRSGQTHQLVNDTGENVEILVIQVQTRRFARREQSTKSTKVRTKMHKDGRFSSLYASFESFLRLVWTIPKTLR